MAEKENKGPFAFSPEAIASFRGKYYFLSNFYLSNFQFRGVFYKSAEHAYQAAKAINSADAMWISSARTPKEAKLRGRKVQIRPDWNEVKLSIMEEILLEKFHIPILNKFLLSTGDKNLIEGNYWNDTFWGVNDKTGMGENHLGKLLEKVRAAIKANKIKKVIKKGVISSYYTFEIDCPEARFSSLDTALPGKEIDPNKGIKSYVDESVVERARNIEL